MWIFDIGYRRIVTWYNCQYEYHCHMIHLLTDKPIISYKILFGFFVVNETMLMNVFNFFMTGFYFYLCFCFFCFLFIYLFTIFPIAFVLSFWKWMSFWLFLSFFVLFLFEILLTLNKFHFVCSTFLLWEYKHDVIRMYVILYVNFDNGSK